MSLFGVNITVIYIGIKIILIRKTYHYIIMSIHLRKTVALFCGLAFCCLSAPYPVTAGKNDNGKVTTLKTGPVIPATGYLYNGTAYPKDSLPEPAPSTKDGKWEILFDGIGTAQWRGIHSDSFPSYAWAVEGGSLFVKNQQGGEDIITRDAYTNFDLVFDFKLTTGANSGVKYSVEYIRNNRSGDRVWNGPEYQIIDDYNHPAVKDNKDPEGSTAAFYLLYAPQNKKLLPAGQWNKGRILVKGTHVEHWLNGIKVVSYERASEDCRARMAKTKFANYDHYGELVSGHIMLTDHDGDKVEFRDIRIKRLK